MHTYVQGRINTFSIPLLLQCDSSKEREVLHYFLLQELQEYITKNTMHFKSNHTVLLHYRGQMS